MPDNLSPIDSQRAGRGECRDDYVNITMINTRWHDNDIYGHVNNVIFYSFFDTAVNRYLIEHCALSIHSSPIIAFVVSSSAQYFEPVVYPQVVEVGLRVARLGKSSVTYELGIFVEGEAQIKAAGEFVHVFVDRELGSATPIPEPMRHSLQALLKGGSAG